MKLAELLSHLPPAQLFQCPDPTQVAVSHVTGDSRMVQSGSLFVAVPGRQVDGHRFLPAAAALGASAALGSKSPDDLRDQGLALPAHLPYVVVPDTRAVLAGCSAAVYAFPSRSLAVIGVTGTDGKTTTASLIEWMLAQASAAPGEPGRAGVITTVGARIRGRTMDTGLHVTTPDAPDVQRFLADMRDSGCRYAIVESTSHGLAQGRVAAVDFDVAVVTNITHEHLDEHGTREAYVAAKALLFRSLYRSHSKPGVPRFAVLNRDDAGSYGALQQAMAEEAARSGGTLPIRSYSMEPARTADVAAADITYTAQRTTFSLTWWGGRFAAATPLIGDFNVANALAAATAALGLGMTPAQVQAALASFPGVEGRMERIDEGQPYLALVDFAHTPASLERALLTLRHVLQQSASPAAGRLIAIFGSAGLRDREKRRLMGRVSGRLADFTVITAEDPRTEDLAEINRSIEAGVREFAPENAYVIEPDRAAAIQLAVDMARPGDIVATFGKGHERSMCFGVTETPWHEQQVLRTALRRRVGGQ